MSPKVCLSFNPNKKDLTLNIPKEEQIGLSEHQFTFDNIFDMESTQKEVYEIAALPIIDSKCLNCINYTKILDFLANRLSLGVFDGLDGTILAYGQTSSGKTHTMEGPNIVDQEL